MKTNPHYVKWLLAGVLIKASLVAQTSMLTEFKAMPAFPTDANTDFVSSKTTKADSRYMYQDNSQPVHDYSVRLQNDTRPYQDIVTAKGQQGIPSGKAAASDFSDLSSPETQAKIARMSKEEQMKFAMEIQARMNGNANIQAVQAQTRPSPLLGTVLKLSRSCDTLFATLKPFIKGPQINLNVCDFHCREYDDKPCYDRMTACNRKVSRDHYNEEINRYNTFIKSVHEQYELKRKAFENRLKEYDAEAAKYPANDIAGDNINALSMIMRISGMLSDYEKQGAMIVLEAKNDPYCGKDF